MLALKTMTILAAKILSLSLLRSAFAYLDKATIVIAIASDRHSGVYTSVSSSANRVLQTALKNPTYRKSPMARPVKIAAIAQTPNRHNTRSAGTGIQSIRIATVMLIRNKPDATAKVQNLPG